MRVLLIDPIWTILQYTPHLGLGHLAAMLRKEGHECRVIEMKPGRTVDYLKQQFSRFQPQIVGVTSMTSNYPAAMEWIRITRKHLPTALTIAGGQHITLQPERTLRENPYLDLACCGEGDELLVRVCEQVQNGSRKWDAIPGLAFRRNGEVVTNGTTLMPDLEKLPYPDFQAWVEPIRSWGFGYPITTSRGCPYKCGYCSIPKISGTRFRYRSPKHVIEELRYAKQEYGIRRWSIWDDTFTQKIGRVKELCDALIEADLGLKFCTSQGIRADRTDQELAQKMARAGCTMASFGIEAVDDETFDGLNKSESLEDVRRGISYFRDAGIRVGGLFMLGLPRQTFSSALRIVQFCRENGLETITLSFLHPFEGTDFGVWARSSSEVRWLRPLEGSRANPWGSGQRAAPVIETTYFPEKEQMLAWRLICAKTGSVYQLFGHNTPLPIRVLIAAFLTVGYAPELLLRYICEEWNRLRSIARSIIPKNHHIGVLPSRQPRSYPGNGLPSPTQLR